ncbi:alpha/beta hydrolase [Thermogymnomonas acidicola]|uniref:Alpha/beta hydrolase n=1 Tax=Thermogymnomonas acidicola TaxID=399579 RepID=A0AA37BRE4_9ARCH|nr:alpha/beta hydrolase [Thermogymnomonas acidicola]
MDPQIRNMLKILENNPMPDPRTTPLDRIRSMERLAVSQVPEISVRSVRDTVFRLPGRDLKVRIYDDAGSDCAILYLHGGGFVLGSIETHDAMCRYMAKHSGAKVFSVDYRLAPESKFPAAAEDAIDSYAYLMEHSPDFGISSERICIAGDSAGGNLTAVACAMAKMRGLRQPRLQALFYPVVGPDFASESYREYGDGLILTHDLMSWFSDQYLNGPQDALDPRFSPILLPDLSGLADAVIVTAEYDPLRDQGETYAERLRRHGVNVTAIRVSGMVHGFLSSAFYISRAAEDTLRMVSSLIGSRLRE